jgi:hypothetical protein
MKISTVREFRDNASGMLRAKDPILVTRRGRLAGIFFPRPETTLPVELKREMFGILSAEVEEYASILGRKKKLTPETLMLAVASLPVSIVAHEIYAKAIVRARR